jgi:hypothetical protein
MSIAGPASSPTPKAPARSKVDLVSAPCAAILAACVLAGLGQSRESELLLWQLPLALVVASVAYVGFRARQARRRRPA